MIRATFKTENGGFCGFEIAGHSGYASAGSDIVCAAVSAMAGLVIHIAADIYKDGGKVLQDEKNARLSFLSADSASFALIEGLHGQIAALAEEYPEYVTVKIKETVSADDTAQKKE